MFIISIVFSQRYTLISKINKITKNKEEVQDITFEMYSNENNILKMIVTAQDTENGIDKVIYTTENNEKKEIKCYGKNKVSMDYEITKDGEYEIKAVNKIGEEIIKTLNVNEEFRNNIINIDVKTEADIATRGKVNIYYNQSKNKEIMYKIGERGNWTNYNGEFTIDSYEIIKDNLQDNNTKTITIYSKIEDNAKNTIIISKKLSNIDVDMAKKPTISYTGENNQPILKENGVFLTEDIKVNIKYDEREDILNYYSCDSGNTWNLYTGEIQTNVTNVIAKSVKKSGLENSETCYTVTNKEALGVKAYDGKNDTSENYTWSDGNSGRKLNIDKTMWKQYAKINMLTGGDNDHHSGAIICYNNNNEEICRYKFGWSLVGNIYIAENTSYIAFEIDPWSSIYVYEVTYYDLPLIYGSAYPKITSTGVEEKNENITIKYYSKSIKKLYSTDGENWKNYPDSPIQAENGTTIYAKGIDENNKETEITSYTYKIENAIGEAAYDGNESTAFNDQQTDQANYYLDIDPSLYNKKLKIYFNSTSNSYCYGGVTFIMEDGTEKQMLSEKL